MRYTGYLLLALAGVWTAVQVTYLSPRLPDSVASHFGKGGVADDWMPRSRFLSLQLSIQIGMAVFLVGVAEYSHRLPDSVFNMPNKEYWLHKDRRDSTFRYNANVLNLIAGVTAIFLAAIFQLIYRANFAAEQVLSGALFIPALAVYLLAMLAIVILPVRKFLRLPEDAVCKDSADA